MAAIIVKREGTGGIITFDTVAEVGSAAEFISCIEKVWGEGVLLKPSSTSAFTARTPEPFPHGIYTFLPKSGAAKGQGDVSIDVASLDEGTVMVDAETDEVPVRSFKVPRNQQSKLNVASIEKSLVNRGLVLLAIDTDDGHPPCKDAWTLNLYVTTPI